MEELKIGGAAEFNLRGIDCEMPLGKLVAVTGPSGAGKSALVFEVIARWAACRAAIIGRGVYLPHWPKVETVQNLPLVVTPHLGSSRKRESVADLLGVSESLAQLAVEHGQRCCHRCGVEIDSRPLSEVVRKLSENRPSRVFVGVVLPRATRGQLQEFLDRGFTRAILNGELARLGDSPDGIESLFVVLLDEIKDSHPLRRVSEGIAIGLRLIQELSCGTKVVFLDADSLEQLASVSGTVGCPACGAALATPTIGSMTLRIPDAWCRGCDDLGEVYSLSPDRLRDLALDGELRRWFRAVFPSRQCADERYQEFSKLDLDVFCTNTRFSFSLSGLPEGPDVLRDAALRVQKTRRRAMRELLLRPFERQICGECNGTRLSAAEQRILLGRHSFSQLLSLSLARLVVTWDEIQRSFPTPGPAANSATKIRNLLTGCLSLGLGHLQLSRSASSLSSGEKQRLLLVSALSLDRKGLLYLLDEPTASLHSQDVGQVIRALRELVSNGSTVVAVEHNPQVVAASDWELQLGPGGGPDGGTITYAGHPRLADAVPSRPLIPFDWSVPHLKLDNIRVLNLNIPELKIPQGRLTVISGVSGAGKSTLLFSVVAPSFSALSRRAGAPVLTFSASAIRHAQTTTVGKLLGISELVFQRFLDTEAARIQGLSDYRKLLCPECRGSGQQKYGACGSCDGSGVSQPELTWRGVLAGEIHRFSLEEIGTNFSRHPEIRRRLASVNALGISYLRFSQSARNLSNGELQRVKLASVLRFELPRVFVFDEPARGLSEGESERLVALFKKMTSAGHTLIVAEHKQSFLSGADYRIDLGPGSGERGGLIVAEGAPALSQ